MEKLSYFKVLRLLAATLAGIAVLSLLSSCEDDSPEPKIEYYFTIACKPPDYSPVPIDDNAYIITAIMKDSIRRIYPKPILEGDDARIVALCDRIYYRFLNEHPDARKYFYCVAIMHRARKTSTIIKNDQKIRYYDF